MPDLWFGLTFAQALIVIAVGYGLVRAIGAVYYALRGTRPPVEHCEHCALLETLDERLDKLVDVATDSYGELERITAAVESIRDDDAGLEAAV